MGSILTKIKEIQDDLEFEIETLKKGNQTNEVIAKIKELEQKLYDWKYPDRFKLSDKTLKAIDSHKSTT